MTVRWLDDARRDVISIRRYIAQHNPTAASRVAERIDSLVSRLDGNSYLGRPGRIPGTRELVITGTPYIVAYRVTDQAVEVIAVRHGARKWPDRL